MHQRSRTGLRLDVDVSFAVVTGNIEAPVYLHFELSNNDELNYLKNYKKIKQVKIRNINWALASVRGYLFIF